MNANWILPALLTFAPAQAATSAECEQILQKALHDKNPDTRALAAVALSLAGSRGPLLPDLVELIHDKDVKVRLAAITSLTEVPSQGASDALHTALADPVPEVSFAAAKALWARKDPAGGDLLRDVLEGESKASSPFITREKRQAAHMLHTPRALFLYALFQGAGLAPVPGLGGLASLQSLLLDPHVSGRATAALLLGNDKNPATLRALQAALRDKDWSVRAAAAHSVALRNDPSLLPDLEPLLTDKKEAVRLRAAAGYLRLSALPRDRTGE